MTVNFPARQQRPVQQDGAQNYVHIHKVCHINAAPPLVSHVFMCLHAFPDVLGSPGNIYTPNRMPRPQAEVMGARDVRDDLPGEAEAMLYVMFLLRTAWFLTDS